MILNTTYLTKEMKKNIIENVGKKISLFDSLSNGSRGSHRMIILEYSESFKSYLKKKQDTLYGSIERRDNGIIIRISNNLETISWLIPYYKLSIFKSNLFSIHSSGNYIKFQIDNNYHMNKKFISRLMKKTNTK